MQKEGLSRRPLLKSSITSKINPELVKSLASNQLSFDMYFILNTLKEKDYELWRIYEASVRISQLTFQFLHREDYIKTNISKLEKYTIENVELSNSGLELFKEGVEDWIVGWRELWPKGIVSGGYPVRSDLPGIIKKMKSFLRKHDYSKDEIITATKLYLKERQENGWAYMKLAGYFIEKDGDSTLASFCDRARDGETVADDPFVTKV